MKITREMLNDYRKRYKQAEISINTGIFDLSRCEICKKDLIGMPKIYHLTQEYYQDPNFCSKKCLIKYITEKIKVGSFDEIAEDECYESEIEHMDKELEIHEKDSKDKNIQTCSFGNKPKKQSKEEQDKIWDFMNHSEAEERNDKKMKVKFLDAHNTPQKLEERINSFINGKNVRDIKYQTVVIECNDNLDIAFTALVLYDE